MRRATWTDYASGRDRRRNPLQRGLVFAASPCLGPTGNRLFDVSTYALRGEFNGLTVDDWVLHNGQYMLDLDGVGDYIAFGNFTHLDLVNNYSISAWIYPRSTDGLRGVFSKTGFSDGGIQLTINAGTIRFPQFSSASASISANTLYHVCCVRRGAGANTPNEIWLNGQLAGSNTSVDPSVSTTYGATIGRLYGGIDNYYFDGLIGEVCVWNRPLGPREIRELSRVPGAALVSYPRRSSAVLLSLNTSSAVSLTAGAGAGTGAGHTPSVMAGAEVAAGAGAGSGSGHAPDVSHGHALSAGAGAGTGTGHAPSLSIGGAVSLTAGAGSGSGAGHAPSVVNGHALTAGVGSGTGVGYSTAPEIGAFISIGSGAGTGAGYAPTVTAGGAALTVSRRKLFLSGGLFV